MSAYTIKKNTCFKKKMQPQCTKGWKEESGGSFVRQLKCIIQSGSPGIKYMITIAHMHFTKRVKRPTDTPCTFI